MLDEAVSAGITRIRDEIWWESVESSPGTYNWTAYRDFLALAKSKGVEVLYIIQNTPGWANGGQSYKVPPSDPATYGRFCGETARTLGPLGVKALEVWNEPNLRNFWQPAPDAAKYTALLRACYTAIKQAYPSITVVSAGLSAWGNYGQQTADGINPLTFLERMYAAGAAGYFDALGWHPYSSAGYTQFQTWSGWHQMYATSPSARSLMQANGDGAKSIWATEWGTKVVEWCSGSEQCQADRTKAGLDAWKTFAWAGPIYFYNEWGGIDGDFSAARADWSKRPVWYVLASYRP